MRFIDKNGNVLPGQKWYSATQAQVQAAVDARIQDETLVVGDVIPEENVAITTETTDVDLKAYGEWTDGIFVNTNGSQTANVAYTLSDFYPAAALSILSKKANFSMNVCYYAADKSWLGRKGSGYTTANEPLVIEPLENAAFLRVNMAVDHRTNSNLVGIYMPMTVKTYDWQNTADSRMNQLAVREDLYAKIDELRGLLWNYTKWNGKTLVVDGNSLVASVDWGASLASFLGMTRIQCGMSGSELTKNETTGGRTRVDILNNIKDAYPAAADLVILQGDTNQGTLSGDPADQMDGETPKATWMARMNYMIRCIKAKYPNVVLVLMPDSVRYDSALGQTPAAPCIYYSGNAESRRAMKAVADANFCYYFDFDHDTPFDPLSTENYYSRFTAASDFTVTDGTHPNDRFAYAKGRALAHWVAGLTFHPNAPNTARDGWENYVSASITNNLTGVTNSKTATLWQYYMPYTATLTAESGSIQSVTITMGGNDVTSSVYTASTGKINIKRVTGDLVITASNV